MKTIHFILILLVGYSLTISCSKDQDIDYLIFGHFYGECGGEKCVEIFKIENNRLYEDRNDIYPSYQDYYNGDFEVLSSIKFDQVKDLIDFFPDGLLEETENVIGMPDAGDWGGLYIENNVGGVRRFWLIDIEVI